MNEAEVVAALDIPPSARVDQRVPKKMLVENGAPTAADKRSLNEGIEEIVWLAALKPTTIGIPMFRDGTREYLEIAILRATLRTTAKAARIAELVHRAVPYPVFLITTQGDALTLSLAHKRYSQGEAGATVLDGAPLFATPAAAVDPDVTSAFSRELAVARQPRADLFALYEGWMNLVVALLVAQVTGTFTLAPTPEFAASRRAALAECERLQGQMESLRAAAAKERQVARQVDLNLELRRVLAEHSAARARL